MGVRGWADRERDGTAPAGSRPQSRGELTAPGAAEAPRLISGSDVLAAQRLAGNSAVQRLIGTRTATPARTAQRAPADTAVAGSDPATLDAATGGQVAYTYSTTRSSGGSFQFTDPDYNSLMATLTARMGKEEIGRCQPALTLVLNGVTIPQDGSTVALPFPDTTPVSTGTRKVVDAITLPTWTNVGASAVQQAQRDEWNRYAGAVSAHEDLHAADDKATYDPVAAGLGAKTVGDAIDAVSAATSAANDKAGPRDQSDPPPTLNPAGTTSVPSNP